MAKKFNGPKGTIYLRDVPKNVRDLFHAACVRRGKTMKCVLVEFMNQYANKGVKGK